ncbi:MAG: deoxyguanosinetriphosphate triphosphohydrolase [bacterium]|nr:deoxyguanosinetriphosphate triphosphohydrolase [bacterium]
MSSNTPSSHPLYMREHQIAFEQEHLSPRAAQAATSRGRLRSEAPCEWRTEFQRDRDRIIHCKAFRRLKHKTQVFISPDGDHYRTRLTHTLEVAQVSRSIGRALRLNEDLIEAICMGHDLGHPAFGHTGEHALARVVPGGFQHNAQSLRVVDVLMDLNLTAEVRDGIRWHTGVQDPFTLEGQIVKIADRVAYLNHDVDDALRAGILRFEELPERYRRLGANHSQRIGAMIKDLILYSRDQDKIKMSPEMWDIQTELRIFMFQRVYLGSEAKSEEHKARRLVADLFHHFMEQPAKMREIWGERYDEANHTQHVVDYVAGMTDRYAIKVFEEIFVPRPWTIFGKTATPAAAAHDE